MSSQEVHQPTVLYCTARLQLPVDQLVFDDMLELKTRESVAS